MISRRFHLIFFVLTSSLSVFSYGQSELIDSLSTEANKAPQRYILKGVNVINPIKSTTAYKRTVVINDREIESVKGNWRSWFMKGQKIDCKGKFISPGLVDAHVHLHCSYKDRIGFVRYGVTSVIGFTPGPDIQENAVADSLKLPFPVIYGEGQFNLGFEGRPGYLWPVQEDALPLALVAQTDKDYEVQNQIDVNYSHFKVSPKIEQTRAYHTFLLGRYLEKCRSLDYGYFRRFITPPAIALHEKAARVEMIDYTNSISPMLYEDYRILFGSDVKQGYYQDGYTLFNEINLHRPLNLRPDQILEALCVTPYLFLNKEVPQVRAGDQANLVLYDQNPLKSIGVLSKPWMVILRGYAMDQSTLKYIDTNHE